MSAFQYQSNTTLEQIAADLKAAKRVLITTHAKPDGDALGSVIALAASLEKLGVTVDRWIMPPIPHNLGIIRQGVTLLVHGESDHAEPAIEPDLIVVTDTGAYRQVEPLQPWLATRAEKTIVVDHHLHGDPLGTRLYIDPTAAAVCEIVTDLIEALGITPDIPTASALYIGIASDTGWFRFSNTTPKTHRTAARLLEIGIDHGSLYVASEQSERPEKLALWALGLQSLNVVADGRAAVMTLHNKDFQAVNARHEETDRLVDIPQIVGSVQVVALLTEAGDGQTRMSFRSKPGPDAIDVNQLAQIFGGGGHARAAGARTDQPIEQTEAKVIGALESIEWPRHASG